ncbi:hypothetical protein [Promicromonospora sp. NPDC023987]|uniref:hypothetical protein n=1 Tax=Promicromonospora sp. NPDC023987 TaxID=3155360 RepID=UPI0033D5F56E
MIGILDWDIRAARTTLNVLGGSINIDDQNIPAITAAVTVPFDADVLAALDPRSTNVPRVTLNGSLTEWASRPISAISEYAGARTIAGLSELWSGLQGRDVSALFGSPLHSLAQDKPQTMSLDLHVREVSYDDWEMVIDLASDEALLTDWAPSNGLDMVPIIDASQGLDPQKVGSWVNSVLIGVLGYKLTPTVYDDSELSDVYSNITNWQSFPTAWDMFRPYIDDTNLKLRVNPNGVGFSLQRPENTLWDTPGQHSHLFTAEEVISVGHVYTRSGDWYDGAMLSDAADEYHIGYPATGPSRTYRETLPEGTKPTFSMAQNIVTRASNRGHLIDIVAPIRLGVFMRDEFAYAPEVGDIEQWVIKSVSYDLTTATMRIRGEQRY